MSASSKKESELRAVMLECSARLRRLVPGLESNHAPFSAAKIAEVAEELRSVAREGATLRVLDGGGGEDGAA